MRPFVVCIHDATPAFARETRTMIRDIAPLLGRRLSFGVVPDWHGEWPLTAHPDYCRLVSETSAELLLHGYFHRRERGRGITTWLTNGCDELNGLDHEQTRRTLERGQRVFTDVFGQPARGFLAPGWRPGHVRPGHVRPGHVCPGHVCPGHVCPGHGRPGHGRSGHMDSGRVGAGTLNALGLEHVPGFFSLESSAGESIPLATWTWDCGRWEWLGHVGHGIGRMLQYLDGRVPVLAIHPRDLERGFWPKILRLTGELLEAGYEPGTFADLLGPVARGESRSG